MKDEDQIEVKHVAISVNGGPWISKLGQNELVEHRGATDKAALSVVQGDTNGFVNYWYSKDVSLPLATPPHQPAGK